MNTFTVTFIGHRQIDCFSAVEQQLERILESLFFEKEYICFYVGRNGDFDQMAASTVLRLKKRLRNDNSSLIWALPYLTAEFRENEKSFTSYYDEVELFDELNGCHPKAAIQKRNRLMVDKADLVIAYVKTNTGGAYQTLRYAERSNKEIFNLYNIVGK